MCTFVRECVCIRDMCTSTCTQDCVCMCAYGCILVAFVCACVQVRTHMHVYTEVFYMRFFSSMFLLKAPPPWDWRETRKLRVFPTLPEELSSNPNTHIGQLTSAYTSSFRGSSRPIWLPCALTHV